MKTFTKLALLLLFFGSFFQLRAADLVVQDLGPTGTFASITAAINASSDGDRIIIVNRAGGLPWQENVVVNKTLTFLPAIDGTRFLVNGDWTISPPISGKSIRIVGMENLGGNILANSDAPAGPRTKVEIVGCDLTGGIFFSHNYFDVLVSGNVLEDDIRIRFGNVYGNDLHDYDIEVVTDALPGNEVIDIIGNRCYRIIWTNSSHFFRINNNFVDLDVNTSATALAIGNLKNSPANVNTIENNSILIFSSSGSSSKTGIGISTINATNATLNILNNAIDASTPSANFTQGITHSSSSNFTLFLGYNHVDVSFDVEISTNITPNGTNVSNQSLAVNSVNGTPSGNAILNGGHPGKDYTDHDLSRNDPGCYGGSFNFNNYFLLPIGPQVFHVETPRTVIQGGNINVSAQGFDR